MLSNLLQRVIRFGYINLDPQVMDPPEPRNAYNCPDSADGYHKSRIGTPYIAKAKSVCTRCHKPIAWKCDMDGNHGTWWEDTYLIQEEVDPY